MGRSLAEDHQPIIGSERSGKSGPKRKRLGTRIRNKGCRVESRGVQCSDSFLNLRPPNRNSMEPAFQDKKTSEEYTRDSLIEISQLVPEKVLQPDLVPNSTSAAAASASLGTGDEDAVEDYRSKLISISYTESPDAKKPQP